MTCSFNFQSVHISALKHCRKIKFSYYMFFRHSYIQIVNNVTLNDFVMFHNLRKGLCISDLEYNGKLKFSM